MSCTTGTRSMPACRAVIEEYEARARAKKNSGTRCRRRRPAAGVDEMLLPVGHATGALLNLLIKEGRSPPYPRGRQLLRLFHHWLAAGARAVRGKVTSLELQAPKTEYARARLARAGLADYVEFRIGDALASLRAARPGPLTSCSSTCGRTCTCRCSSCCTRSSRPAPSSSPTTCCSPTARGCMRGLPRAGARRAEMSSVLLSVGNGLELSRYRAEGDLHALVVLALAADPEHRMAPISAMLATCVPPQGCRSIPGMLQQPHAAGAARRLHAHRLHQIRLRLKLGIADPHGLGATPEAISALVACSMRAALSST